MLIYGDLVKGERNKVYSSRQVVVDLILSLTYRGVNVLMMCSLECFDPKFDINEQNAPLSYNTYITYIIYKNTT